jgi:hypothetical protein
MARVGAVRQMADPWRGSGSKPGEVRDGQDNRVRTMDGRKLTILGSGSGPASSPRSAPEGVQSEGTSTSSEELGGGMEVGRRRFGQRCETSLVAGRGQTQPRARRRRLAAYRFGRGCDAYQQTRPKPPRLVTATTGKAASGRCVNREVLRLAIATLLIRRDQHESTRGVGDEINASTTSGLLDDRASARHG